MIVYHAKLINILPKVNVAVKIVRNVEKKLIIVFHVDKVHN